MFEDALVESADRLKTPSKYWMFGAFVLNGGLLAIMILMPLLYPEALPKAAITATLIAPPPPPAPAPQVVRAVPEMQQHMQRVATFTAPRQIPTQIREDAGPLPSISDNSMVGPHGPGGGDIASDILTTIGNGPVMPTVKVKPAKPLAVSSGVEAGNLIVKPLPVYPAIAQAAHITGSVVLHAIISKTGTIENLSVESGPLLLRQAALDGVKRWRYRPFLLNGEPTEVDTTITVNFAAS